MFPHFPRSLRYASLLWAVVPRLVLAVEVLWPSRVLRNGFDCTFQNICFQTRTRQVSASSSQSTHLILGTNLRRFQCCVDSTCTDEPICLCFYNLGKRYGHKLELVFSDVQPKYDVSVSEPAILVDPLHTFMQFGHYSSRLLQVFHLAFNPRYKAAVFLRGRSLDAKCTSHLCELERLTTANITVVHPDENMVCLGEALSPIAWETTFWSSTGLQRWREVLGKKLGLGFNRCPYPSVYVLSRDTVRNGGERRILNMEDVGAALLENGIPCFKHVYFNSSGSMRDHISWFHEAGIVIAARGSVFKNMMYAQPNSIFIELLSHDRFVHHQPFKLKAGVADWHFISTSGHGMSGRCSTYSDCDIKVNRSVLSNAIRQGLQQHRNAGCHLVEDLICKTMN